MLLGGCHSFCILAAPLVPFSRVAPSGADAPFSKAPRPHIRDRQGMRTECLVSPDVSIPCYKRPKEKPDRQ